MLGLHIPPPAAAHPAAAAFWRDATQHDTAAVSQSLVDSVVIKSPLPDPLVPIVQWIFQKPGWLMATGIVLGALVAVTGPRSYDFMMHDNDFCAGCQIFVPSGQVFVRPDTETYVLVNKEDGKHDTLECHACHPFEVERQTKTLLAWMVARPDEIPPHGKVPRDDAKPADALTRYGPGSRLRPPLPFDTTQALQQTSSREPPRGLSEPGRARGKGAAPPEDDLPGSRTDVSASPSDTFPHERHSRLACLTCHDLRAKGRRLTFEAPRGCQICHHQRPAQADCGSCHQPSELAPTLPTQVAVAVPQHDRRRRTVQFPHAKHDTLACAGCHVTPVTLAPADSVLTCAGCHDKHHAQSRDCAACHRTAAITAAHQRPVQAHMACDACHTPATVARLVPTRSLCLACHQPQQDHYPPKECSACHFQRTPDQLEPQLRRTGQT